MKHIPYFYIIEHINSGTKYAGSRWSKKPTHYSENGCNPIEFMQLDGYMTSSSKIKFIIKQDGISSFKILTVMTEEQCGDNVYAYECNFLKTSGAAFSTKWFNKHDNTTISNGAVNGTKWYNNGIFEKQFIELNLDDNTGWKLGRLNRSNLGEKIYNDGNKMKYFAPHELIPEGMVLGKLTRTIEKTAASQKKLKIFNDGIKEYHLDPNVVDIANLNPGKLTTSIEKMSNISKGTQWYNDGTKNFVIREGEAISQGLTKGRLPNQKTYKWYNNGMISLRIYNGDHVPFNFVRGQAPNDSSKKLYNNGIIEKYFKENSEIPEEFSLGGLKKRRARGT